jgi:Zn-dependent M32 family carboxypeptidase
MPYIDRLENADIAADRENIHRHGGRYDPDELIERVTGRTLDTAPYLRGKLYEL